MSQPLNPAQSVENLKVSTEALSESSLVTTVPDVAGSLAGTYFTLHDGLNAAHYVWLKVGGSGADPAPGGTGHEVDVATNATAAQIAAAIQAVVAAVAEFSAALASDTQVRISNTHTGPANDATAGTSGFTVTVIRQGQADRYSPAFPTGSLNDNPAAF